MLINESVQTEWNNGYISTNARPAREIRNLTEEEEEEEM